ncbi:hypothetical protein OVV49_28220, partial [Klebsiella pneumoniae]|nr:hypothetical protein [Klebsiella pneumoniae]
ILVTIVVVISIQQRLLRERFTTFTLHIKKFSNRACGFALYFCLKNEGKRVKIVKVEIYRRLSWRLLT